MYNLIKLIKRSDYVFVCGNGGSAANAEHLTSDLISKGIKAVCLNSNCAVLTMIANDYGYRYIFSKQLAVLAGKNDLLITISCSGRSANIVQAIKTAGKIGMKHYSMQNRKITKETDYAQLECSHLAFIHKLKASL